MLRCLVRHNITNYIPVSLLRRIPGNHETVHCDLAEAQIDGSAGQPCNVFTVIASDLGPSPAGLNAKICIRYSVYLSRNTKLWDVDVAATTSISSSIFLPSSISWGILSLSKISIEEREDCAFIVHRNRIFK